MVSKIFVDANILLDFVLEREQYEAANELFHYIANGNVNGFISPSIVHLVAYRIKKSQGTEKVKPALTSIFKNIHVVDVGHDITIEALSSDINDVEDALQYYAAVAHHMDIFISNDKKLKRLAMPSLLVLNPAEFLLTLRLQ